MINYNLIESANKAIRTTDIKGKDYAEVNQRIKAFRMVYPNGSIETEIVTLQDGIVTMKAFAKDEEGKIIGTGFAQEKEGSTFINKTSYIENCETSAVGRALGMCGFGIDTSVASAEEVQNAINNQDDAKPKQNQAGAQQVKATEKQIGYVKNILKTDDRIKAMLDFYHIAKIEDLTVAQASDIIKRKGQ